METFKSNFMLFVINIWIDIRKMHTSKLTNYLTYIVVFQHHFVRWCKLGFNQLVDLQIQVWVYTHRGVYTQAISKKVYRGKMTHIDFPILNCHETVMFFYFFCGKIENFKIAVFFSCYLSLCIRCAFFKARKLL